MSNDAWSAFVASSHQKHLADDADAHHHSSYSTSQHQQNTSSISLSDALQPSPTKVLGAHRPMTADSTNNTQTNRNGSSFFIGRKEDLLNPHHPTSMSPPQQPPGGGATKTVVVPLASITSAGNSDPSYHNRHGTGGGGGGGSAAMSSGYSPIKKLAASSYTATKSGKSSAVVDVSHMREIAMKHLFQPEVVAAGRSASIENAMLMSSSLSYTPSSDFKNNNISNGTSYFRDPTASNNMPAANNNPQATAPLRLGVRRRLGVALLAKGANKNLLRNIDQQNEEENDASASHHQRHHEEEGTSSSARIAHSINNGDVGVAVLQNIGARLILKKNVTPHVVAAATKEVQQQQHYHRPPPPPPPATPSPPPSLRQHHDGLGQRDDLYSELERTAEQKREKKDEDKDDHENTCGNSRAQVDPGFEIVGRDGDADQETARTASSTTRRPQNNGGGGAAAASSTVAPSWFQEQRFADQSLPDANADDDCRNYNSTNNHRQEQQQQATTPASAKKKQHERVVNSTTTSTTTTTVVGSSASSPHLRHHQYSTVTALQKEQEEESAAVGDFRSVLTRARQNLQDCFAQTMTNGGDNNNNNNSADNSLTSINSSASSSVRNNNNNNFVEANRRKYSSQHKHTTTSSSPTVLHLQQKFNALNDAAIQLEREENNMRVATACVLSEIVALKKLEAAARAEAAVWLEYGEEHNFEGGAADAAAAAREFLVALQ